MVEEQGASSQGEDRATHEQSPQAVSAAPVGIPSAVDYSEAPRTLYVMFTEIGGCRHIRKWSVDRPFAGAAAYAHAGNGALLGPLDSSEHYPPEMLPQALRFVAEHLWCECEPHVIEDMVRIVTDAAQAIEAKRPAPTEQHTPASEIAGAVEGEAK